MLHGLPLWVVQQLRSPVVLLQYILPLCCRSPAEAANQRRSSCSSFPVVSKLQAKSLGSSCFWEVPWNAAACQGQPKEAFDSLSSDRLLSLATYGLWTTYVLVINSLWIEAPKIGKMETYDFWQ